VVDYASCSGEYQPRQTNAPGQTEIYKLRSEVSGSCLHWQGGILWVRGRRQACDVCDAQSRGYDEFGQPRLRASCMQHFSFLWLYECKQYNVHEPNELHWSCIIAVELHCHSAIIFFILLTLFFACTSIHQEKRFCVKHQMPGMISTSRKTCAHDGCSTIAYFGLEDDKASIFQNFACSCLTLCWPPTMCASIR
jgi:EsV-1-7 cysteine-rich motif